MLRLSDQLDECLPSTQFMAIQAARQALQVLQADAPLLVTREELCRVTSSTISLMLAQAALFGVRSTQMVDMDRVIEQLAGGQGTVDHSLIEAMPE